MTSNKYPLVILYHEISDIEHSSLNGYNINIKPNIFKEHMEVLHNKYSPITFEEMDYSIKNNKDISDRVMVTFDDGYKSAAEYGVDIMSDCNIDSIWFINGDFSKNQSDFWLSKIMRLFNIGKLDDFVNKINQLWPNITTTLPDRKTNSSIDYWGKDNYSIILAEFLCEYTDGMLFESENTENEGRLFVGEKELKEMHNIVEIGNHTYTHPNVRNISLYQLKMEIQQTENFLIESTGTTPRAFAFPFGQPRLHWSPASLRVVEDQGYKYAFSVENNERLVSRNIWNGSDALNLIPRYMVPHNIYTASQFTDYINKCKT